MSKKLLILSFGLFLLLALALAASIGEKHEATMLPEAERITGPASAGAKTPCQLTMFNGTASWFYGSWITGDQVVQYFDPVNCGFSPTYPFEIQSLQFTLYDDGGALPFPVDVDVVVYRPAVSGDSCSGVATELCRMSLTCDAATFGYPNVGTANFPTPCCVNEPFFLGIEYTDQSAGPFPSILFDDNSAPDTCHNWAYTGGTWYEWYNFWTLPPVGYPYWTVNGETNSANCNGGEELELKWEQLPDLDSTGMDISCFYHPEFGPYLLADDFQCTNSGPILEIHVWMSWWQDYLPYGHDSSAVTFTLSIHSDIPASQSPYGYSIPGELLWYDTLPFTVTRYAEHLYEGWLEPPDWWDVYGDSTCWEYVFVLDSDDFIQEGSPDNPIIYWLDLQADPWDDQAFIGWKTSDTQWNDDAAWIKGIEPLEGPPPHPWSELRYVGDHPYHDSSIDLAFAIYGEECPVPSLLYYEINNGAVTTTSLNVTLNNVATNNPTQIQAREAGIPWGAWQQYTTALPFSLAAGPYGMRTVDIRVRNSCGISFIATDSIRYVPDTTVWDDHKMHYPQMPDEAGWDVAATKPVILADDWECSESGYVKDIHFWGSWRHGDEGIIDTFVLSIHKDIPANPPDIPYSRPGETVWETFITNIEPIPFDPPSMEGWYNPVVDYIYPGDHQAYFRYDIYLDTTDWFRQDSGAIYWLNISAIVRDPEGTQWGWKSSINHWNDDAVWAFWGELNWIDIFEPPSDPLVDSFLVSMTPDGILQGWGTGPYGFWEYYPESEWWNVWFYDHPFDSTRRKKIYISFDALLMSPAQGGWLEFALNWSTDWWSLEGNPPGEERVPPLAGVDEELTIRRYSFFASDAFEGHHEFVFMIPDYYNPEWVSIDVMGYNFVIDNGVITHDCVPSLDLAFVITGDPEEPGPPELHEGDINLHNTDGYLPPNGDPLGTAWHELWPEYCQSWMLTSWFDNGDNKLSVCDYVDFTKVGTAEWRKFHVEWVGPTITVTYLDTTAYLEYICHDYPDIGPIYQPVGTWWHEKWPVFSQIYRIIGWEDNGNGYLDSCDIINMQNWETGNTVQAHVEGIDTDVLLKEILTDPPDPLPEGINLHNTNGWKPPDGDPRGTGWHELYPTYCQNSTLTSWSDNGDGKLSVCDTVDFDDDTTKYHVEWLGPTITVSGGPNPLYLDYVGFDNADIGPIYTVIGTYWHEVWPTYCTNYFCVDWTDNGSGVLDSCDYILLQDMETGYFVEYHVTTVETDMIITEIPTGPPELHEGDINLHNKDGYLPPNGDPLGTAWHELWPEYCQNWMLTSWFDNGDNKLSVCDYVDFTKVGTTEWRKFHVEWVGPTITVTYLDTTAYLEYICDDYPDIGPISNVVGTWWHEKWPVFSQIYRIEGWEDNGNGYLDSCDYIYMQNHETGNTIEAHVESIDTDILLKEILTDPPDPLPEGINLHNTNGWKPPDGDPRGTGWHELYPTYCQNSTLTSWSDNGDGKLSVCDTVDFDNDTTKYHVEWLGPTITVSGGPNPLYLDYVGFDNADIGPIATVKGTYWHEVWPTYCTNYFCVDWTDNGNGVLDSCDYILLQHMETGYFVEYHVTAVETDMIITEIPTGPPELHEGDINLHNTDGYLPPNGDPLGTAWHELWPEYCQSWTLTSWFDNNDGKLSVCDYVDFTKVGTDEWRKFHVEWVGPTITVTFLDTTTYLDYICFDYPDIGPISNVVGTWWHEKWPVFSQIYRIEGWEDNGNGYLDSCDIINMQNWATGAMVQAHVEGIDTDVLLKEILTVPPDTLPDGTNMHNLDDWTPTLGTPLETKWHELRPNYCQAWTLTSWFDNGDGKLSVCDYIDFTNDDTEEWKKFHVEWIGPTLTVTGGPNPIYVDYVGFDRAGMEPITGIIGTYWHEVWPTYCIYYYCINWTDNGNGYVDSCDYIVLQNMETGEFAEYHVEDVETDLILSEITPTPPDPLPEGINLHNRNDWRPPLGSPMNTAWHELYPNYCQDWVITSWEDNGDDKLSVCDTVDFNGNTLKYHVEWIGPTITVSGGPSPVYLDYVGFDNADVGPITGIAGTYWHEVFPTYCTYYFCVSWTDNGSGVLDSCDYIVLQNMETGEFIEYHIDAVETDMIVTPLYTPPIWKYHYRGLGYPYDTCVSGDLTVWGTIDCDTTGHDPLFSDSAFKCTTYTGLIPMWANDILINFNWHCFCENKDWAKLTAPRHNGEQWVLENLHGWGSWHNVEVLPAIGDPTGDIQTVYYVVNLNAWVADSAKRVLQDQYEIVDGTCPDLPGYLIGTTPIVFDPNAPPPGVKNGDPFSTTPLTGTLYLNGDMGIGPESACDCVPGEANADGKFNLLDITYLISYLYKGGPAPTPYAICSGDPNCDCKVNLLDITYLISYLYKAGAPPCTCEDWLTACGPPLRK